MFFFSSTQNSFHNCLLFHIDGCVWTWLALPIKPSHFSSPCSLTPFSAPALPLRSLFSFQDNSSQQCFFIDKVLLPCSFNTPALSVCTLPHCISDRRTTQSGAVLPKATGESGSDISRSPLCVLHRPPPAHHYSYGETPQQGCSLVRVADNGG